MDAAGFEELSKAVEFLVGVPTFFCDPEAHIRGASKGTGAAEANRRALDFFARSEQKSAERKDAILAAQWPSSSTELLAILAKNGQSGAIRDGHFDSWHHAGIENYKAFAEKVVYALDWSSKLAIVTRPDNRLPPYAIDENGVRHPGYSLTPDQWRIAKQIATELPADTDNEIRSGIRRERAIVLSQVETQSAKPEGISSLNDNAMMNHTELADQLGIDRESLRKRLERWRKVNATGWQEVADAKAREPKYVYRIGAIKHLLRDAS